MAFLVATGAYLPDRVVANDELAALVGEPADWIRSATGIEQRRYAADGESVSDLAVHAAEDCLARASLAAADLGMIVVSSGSSERFSPGPAGSVAARLGLTSTLALDVPVPSAGSLIGLAMAMRFAPAVGRVLVIGAEIMSRRIDRTPEGRNTAILFGDGAGAALIDPGSSSSPEGASRLPGLRLADAALFTDGGGADVLYMEGDRLHMDGGSVILRASRKLPAAITEVLNRNGIGPETVTQFVLHQANLNLLTRVAGSLKVPADRFFTNIQRYGNTSSASLLIALHEWRSAEAGRVESRTPGPVVLSAFGAGLNWGALLLLPG